MRKKVSYLGRIEDGTRDVVVAWQPEILPAASTMPPFKTAIFKTLEDNFVSLRIHVMCFTMIIVQKYNQ